MCLAGTGGGEGCRAFLIVGIDCDRSLLSPGVAERRRCDLGNRNPN